MSVILACAFLLAVDGDTIRCDHVRMRDMGDGQPGRSGYDAPETGARARCAAEALLGKQARLRLQELLDQPGTYVVASGRRDAHGRPLVWVRLRDGRTAGAVMIAEGYAAPWRPGRKVDWCGP